MKIITWTLERSGHLSSGGGWYYGTTNSITNNDGDKLELVHVLHKDVGVAGIFSDWPATTTMYANCVIRKVTCGSSMPSLEVSLSTAVPDEVGFEVSDVIVELDVWLPVEAALMTTDTVSGFRRAIADAAGVHVEKVNVAGHESDKSGRFTPLRDLDGVKIRVEVAAKDSNVAHSYAVNELSADRVNMHLSRHGLPHALVDAASEPYRPLSARWTGLSYPVGDEKQHARASPMVYIEAVGEAGHIGYHTIYRSGPVPSTFAGMLQRLLLVPACLLSGSTLRSTCPRGMCVSDPPPRRALSA